MLGRVLDKAEEIRKIAKESKIEGGTVGDIESRLRYVEKLSDLCEEAERFLKPVQEGRLI